jgi:hypothetical protein
VFSETYREDFGTEDRLVCRKQATHERSNQVSDPKSADNVGQREEGDDVEAHAFSADTVESADAYRAAANADAYANEEPPDVEGHAFNVDTVDNVD